MIEFDPTLVHEWLQSTARRTPDKEAIICGRDRWTYGKLDAYSDRLAEALIDLGIRRQDRVAILTGNRPETVLCLYGTLKAGGVFLVLEDKTKARRLRYILENSGAKVLVARANQVTIVKEALDSLSGDLRVVWVSADGGVSECLDAPCVTWESIFSALSGGNGETYTAPRDRFPCCVDVDLASLIYTSATTGNPKGVMCTHRNMISAAKSIIHYIDNQEDDIILNVLPLSFGYGLYQVLMSCMFGGTVVLERSFLYPHVILDRIAQEKVTGFPLVPSMVAMLLRMENISKYNFGTLRYITSAGAALPVSHLEHLRRLVPRAKVFNMYGLTECVRVCYLAGDELDERPSSVGWPMPNCEVCILDKNGNEVGPGEVGELAIRGSNVMQGYWNDPEMTAKSFYPDTYPASRWLHSGDYFQRDEEGFLYFLGRKDDMIKTRGERVSPREVENVVCELDGVAETAVVGVLDDILGQAIKVFVVQAGNELTEKDVFKYCANNLNPLMVPKYVEFVSALPRTPHGKVDKRKLQAKEK